MAINDVSLTSGMRSNLLSLQGTVNLLDRTQERLSTGKKVNSAIDNAVSYFAAQSLNSRASLIDGLKDAMGQAVQTVNAADKGISAINSLIEQAKGVAQSALSAEIGTTSPATGVIALSDISEGSAFSTATITLTGVAEDDKIILMAKNPGIGWDFYAKATPTAGNDFGLAAGDMAQTAENLANAITDYAYGMFDFYYSAEYIDGTNTLVVSKYLVADDSQVDFEASDFWDMSSASFSLAVNPPAAADAIEIGGVSFSATTGATGGQVFNVGGDDTADMQELAEVINAYDWGATAFSAEVIDGQLILSKTVNGVDADVEESDFDATGVVGDGSANMTIQEGEEPSEELTSLIAQYNTIRTQLTELAEDSGYKGKNLLGNDNLVVKFEGASLTVEGFDASATGLGISEASWASEADINASIDELDAAASTLSSEASQLSANLSIITVRQAFSTNMINTLTEGADKLTLADTNEEGANMLMLQTRQSLSTTALSLSAQAAQSVLQLFG